MTLAYGRDLTTTHGNHDPVQDEHIASQICCSCDNHGHINSCFYFWCRCGTSSATQIQELSQFQLRLLFPPWKQTFFLFKMKVALKQQAKNGS